MQSPISVVIVSGKNSVLKHLFPYASSNYIAKINNGNDHASFVPSLPKKEEQS